MTPEQKLNTFEKWLRGKKPRKLQPAEYVSTHLYERANFFLNKVATSWGTDVGAKELVEGLQERQHAKSGIVRKSNAAARKAAEAKRQAKLHDELRNQVEQPELLLIPK